MTFLKNDASNLSIKNMDDISAKVYAYNRALIELGLQDKDIESLDDDTISKFSLAKATQIYDGPARLYRVRFMPKEGVDQDLRVKMLENSNLRRNIPDDMFRSAREFSARVNQWQKEHDTQIHFSTWYARCVQTTEPFIYIQLHDLKLLENDPRYNEEHAAFLSYIRSLPEYGEAP